MVTESLLWEAIIHCYCHFGPLGPNENYALVGITNGAVAEFADSFTTGYKTMNSNNT